MFVKNILATLAIAALVAAAPAEDLEERTVTKICPPGTPSSQSWCCKNTVPGFLFFEGVGNDCKHPTKDQWGNEKCYQGTPLCCQHKQIASGGSTSNVVCTK